MNTLIAKADLQKFFEKLILKHEVVAPVTVGKITSFLPVKSFKEVDFTRQSDYSAKKYFLPSREQLIRYKKDKPEVATSQEKRIILMHPCDANAILNLDKVFLNEFPDPYYEARRENTILFVFKCQTAYENCFCSSVNATETVNYDLLFTDIGDKYIVSVGTARAKDLVDNKMFSNVIREGAAGIDCKKKLENVERLGPGFSSKVWEQESERCLSCNACIISCPTCFCFTIRDEPDLDLTSGVRERFWDYCYIQDHTRVAGGFVFRSERYKRFRHRVYHQLRYFREKFGRQLCVGCGRCINVCPTNIDMVEIVNSL